MKDGGTGREDQREEGRSEGGVSTKEVEEGRKMDQEKVEEKGKGGGAMRACTYLMTGAF